MDDCAIKIGAVGRQEFHLSPTRLNEFNNLETMVDLKVIHDDNIHPVKEWAEAPGAHRP